MPSPRLAKTWFRPEKGAWPIQVAPSPPMWVMVLLPSGKIDAAITWQPMPASARLPSGTRVEVLCGQPEQ